jgi:FtsZ-interacting cell division protein YlmF
MNHLTAQRIALKAAQKYLAHLAVVNFHTREARSASTQIELVRPALTEDAARIIDQVLDGSPVTILQPLPEEAHAHE